MSSLNLPCCSLIPLFFTLSPEAMENKLLPEQLKPSQLGRFPTPPVILSSGMKYAARYPNFQLKHNQI